MTRCSLLRYLRRKRLSDYHFATADFLELEIQPPKLRCDCGISVSLGTRDEGCNAPSETRLVEKLWRLCT